MTSPTTVAVVEDNLGICEELRRIITSAPDLACVCVCRNARSAFQLLPGHAPDVIIMDIQLPGMNGIEALHHLRADPRTRAIPVIAVTASAMTHDRQKILAAGFDGYQPKPIEVTQFVAAVRTAVGRPAQADPP